MIHTQILKAYVEQLPKLRQETNLSVYVSQDMQAEL